MFKRTILKEHPEHIRVKFNQIEQVHISSIVYSDLKLVLVSPL
ncbi:hypothetical protein [Candidatus Marithrix sp. Canyon 246]|nr:hypothetical protein [Candidatus Marithrix sp. Canyon 246]